MNPDLEELRRAVAVPLPHPDLDALRSQGQAVLGYLLNHFATLPDQPVGETASRACMEALLREPPPEGPSSLQGVLRRFDEQVDSNAFKPAHPRFLAFIPGAPTFLSALGEFLCAGTNYFAAVWLEAAGPAMVELVVLDWFRSFLGLPAGTSGLLTSGGSEANLTALVVARETVPVADRPRLVLYVADQRHWSVDRAARIMGLLPEQVVPVPCGADLRLTPEHLAPLVARDRAAGRRPWVVVTNAGATNTGAIDPLVLLADFCAEHHLWLHVDAAYGWAAVLGSEVPQALRGIHRADSVTLDPHKWLAQTFEVGGLLVRDGALLRRAFTLRPEYMQDVEPGDDEVNFADHGLALTRRFRALKVWLSVQVLGLGWFRALIDHCMGLARYSEAALRQAGFEILFPPELSIVCFHYLPGDRKPATPAEEEQVDRFNLALVDDLRATGRAFISSTRLRGRVALRFCFVNWRTTADDVDAVVGLLRELARQRKRD